MRQAQLMRPRPIPAFSEAARTEFMRWASQPTLYTRWAAGPSVMVSHFQKLVKFPPRITGASRV